MPAFWSNRLKQLAKAPKRHLADAAFAAAPTTPAMRYAGRLWENAVIAQVRAVAEATLDRPAFTHLRTAAGRQEVDLLITDAGGRTLAIEAKSGSTVAAGDTRHLHWIKDQLPTCIGGLVVHPGERCVQLGDSVAAVPLAAIA